MLTQRNELISQVLLKLRITCIVLLYSIDPDPLLPKTRNLLQNPHLIIGSLNVVRRRLLDLQRHKGVILHVLGQPHGREMPPPELLDNDVPVIHDLAHMHRVIPPVLVVRHPFVLRRVVYIHVFSRDLLPQRRAHHPLNPLPGFLLPPPFLASRLFLARLHRRRPLASCGSWIRARLRLREELREGRVHERMHLRLLGFLREVEARVQVDRGQLVLDVRGVLERILERIVSVRH